MTVHEAGSATSRPEREYRWYRYSESGWIETGRGRTNARTACLSDDGEKAMLLGSRTEIISVKKGGQLVLPGNQSDCSFNRIGPVLTQNSLSRAGNQTIVAQYDLSGRQLWSHDLAIAGSQSTSLLGDKVVVAGQGVVKMYDSRGDLRLDMSDVAGAVLTSASQLVVLDADGRPRWQEIEP